MKPKPIDNKPIRNLAIALLDKDDGINKEAWDQLYDLLTKEGGNDDIIDNILEGYSSGHQIFFIED